MTSNEEKRRLKEEYKTRERTAGVFAVTNTKSGRVFLGSCLDADRPLRRLLFELRMGMSKNRELQQDFNDLGEDAFAFAVLETVDPAAKDIEDRLEQLERKHLAALADNMIYNTDDRIRFR